MLLGSVNRGGMPSRLTGRAWGFGAGFIAGLMGGAIGTPAPPVITYATTQGWSPRVMRANVPAFLLGNQGVILTGYWWWTQSRANPSPPQFPC